MSQPIRHALEAVAVEPKGDNPTNDGHAGGDGPIEGRRHIAEERSADNGDEAIKWIPVEKRSANAVAHDFGAPNDWCDVEQHLHRVGDDLRDIAEAGADDRDDHHHPKQVQDKQDQARDSQQGDRRDGTPEKKKDQRDNKEVVPEDDKIFPHDASYVDPERHFDLKDNTAGI